MWFSGSRYYLRAVATGPDPLASLENIRMFLYADESFTEDAAGEPLAFEDGRWMFSIKGTGFEAKLGIRVEAVQVEN